MSRLARVVLLSTAATGFGLSAMAADLPNPMEPVAPVAYVPAFSWTGFYIGGELGWTQTDPKFTTGALLLGAPFVVTSGSNKNGLTYGVLGGYNYQMGQLVLGIEGDFVAGRLARYVTLQSPEISLRRKANGAARFAGGSATLPIALYST